LQPFQNDLAHEIDGGILSRPQADLLCSLVDEHADAVSGAAACGFCVSQEFRQQWIINDVYDGSESREKTGLYR
jgi:hypothetical protein